MLLRWIPHPVIVTMRDHGEYIRFLSHSCYYLLQRGGSTQSITRIINGRRFLFRMYTREYTKLLRDPYVGSYRLLNKPNVDRPTADRGSDVAGGLQSPFSR